jgi:hypothetical protein
MIYGWHLEGLEEERGLSEEEKTRKATMINDLEMTTLFGGGELEAKIEDVVIKRG